jgi:hypothetical protein
VRQQQVHKRARRRTTQPAPDEQVPTPRATPGGEDRTAEVLAAIDAVTAQQP